MARDGGKLMLGVDEYYSTPLVSKYWTSSTKEQYEGINVLFDEAFHWLPITHDGTYFLIVSVSPLQHLHLPATDQLSVCTSFSSKLIPNRTRPIQIQRLQPRVTNISVELAKQAETSTFIPYLVSCHNDTSPAQFWKSRFLYPLRLKFMPHGWLNSPGTDAERKV